MWVIFHCSQSFELGHLVTAPVRNTNILQIWEHYTCTFLGYCPPTPPPSSFPETESSRIHCTVTVAKTAAR